MESFQLELVEIARQKDYFTFFDCPEEEWQICAQILKDFYTTWKATAHHGQTPFLCMMLCNYNEQDRIANAVNRLLPASASIYIDVWDSDIIIATDGNIQLFDLHTLQTSSSLIFIYECHHIIKHGHPYNNILRKIDRKYARIIGFTDCLLTTDGESLLTDIQNAMNCQFLIPHCVVELCKTSSGPREYTITNQQHYPRAIDLLDDCIEYLSFVKCEKNWQEVDNYRQMLQACVKVMIDFGEWAFFCIKDKLLDNLINNCDSVSDKINEKCTSTIIAVSGRLECDNIDVDDIDFNLYPKVNTLVNVLTSLKLSPGVQRLLICVGNTFTMDVLYYLLKQFRSKCILPSVKISKLYSNSLAMPECFNANRDLLIDYHSMRTTIMIIEQSSPMLLNLPLSHFIICFDGIFDFYPYLQLRSRVLEKLVILTDQKNVNYMVAKYKRWHKVMDYVWRRENSVVEIDNKLQDTTTANCDTRFAITAIYRFCSFLSNNGVKYHFPIWTIEKLSTGYRVILQLPYRLPEQNITGQILATPFMAKASAAMEGVQYLFNHGYLTEYLSPYVKIHNLSRTSYSRDMKKIDIYEKKIATNITGFPITPIESSFIYPLIIEVQEEITPLRNICNHKRHIGIISSAIFPQFTDFSMVTTRGKVLVKVVDYFKRILAKEIITQIHNFNKFIFNEMIACVDSTIFHFDPINGLKKYLLVPVIECDSKYDIDLKMLQTFMDQEPKLYTAPSNCNYVLNFENAMVARNYFGLNALEWLYVSRIRTDMSPSSTFSNQDVASTFGEYYKIKYDIEIQDPEQPLLEVSKFKKSHVVLRCQKQPDSSFHDTRTSSVSSSGSSIILIPELCLIHVIPASFWYLIQYLPVILYRIESILLGVELSEILKSQAKISNIPIDYIINKSDSTDPCLLEAITLSGAQDYFHLERLEFLGDRFLNYKITLMTMINHPSWSLNEVKGRMKFLTRNKKLFRLGVCKGIHYYLIAHPFCPNKTWVPPGYAINEGLPDVSAAVLKEYTHQSLTKKAIADCIEGLIGYVCLVCDRTSALSFMQWLGFETSEYFSATDQLKSLIALKNDVKILNSVETILNYTFRNRSLLLLALTRKSYSEHDNIWSEKLGFLGDTLLTYQICRYLYTQYDRYQPKYYHILLSHLACNRMYGIITVACNLYKYLFPKLDDLTFQIDEICQVLGKDNMQLDCSYNRRAGLLLEKLSIEQFVPKELGELFVAVIAAVLLDSKSNEDITWHLAKSLLNPILDINYTCDDTLPVSLTQQMYELLPNRIRTFFANNKCGSYSICSVTVVLKDSTEKTFERKGKDHEHAKTLAMSALMKYINEHTDQFK